MPHSLPCLVFQANCDKLCSTAAGPALEQSEGGQCAHGFGLANAACSLGCHGLQIVLALSAYGLGCQDVVSDGPRCRQ